MLFETVNFLQDSPYPFAGASGKTPGNGQLHNFFRSIGRKRLQHQKNEY